MLGLLWYGPIGVRRAVWRIRECRRCGSGKRLSSTPFPTESFVTTLVEIKDFGFAYRFREDEDIIFAPWSVLRWMRLAGEGDEFYRS